jgi:hypothetical protein
LSTTTTRIDRATAIEIAKAFVAEIELCTDQLIVAGSLRRRLAYVGDIEIVAVPKVEIERVETVGLFGSEFTAHTVDRLAERLDAMLGAGEVSKRASASGGTAYGPKHKRLLYRGAPIDLFCAVGISKGEDGRDAVQAEPDRFGLILTIRTGPAAYSHQLVTEKGKTVVVGKRGGRPITRVGLLPSHLRVQGGWLTSRVSGIRIPTSTEQEFFERAQLRWLDAWERM